MIFGVSFSIDIDSENIKWTKTNKSITLVRLLIGLSIAFGIEYLFQTVYSDLTNHATIYAFNYLFPSMISTFFIFGIMPGLAEGLGLSRTSYFKESLSKSSSITDQLTLT